jgi:hypothetical protein
MYCGSMCDVVTRLSLTLNDNEGSCCRPLEITLNNAYECSYNIVALVVHNFLK